MSLQKFRGDVFMIINTPKKGKQTEFDPWTFLWLCGVLKENVKFLILLAQSFRGGPHTLCPGKRNLSEMTRSYFFADIQIPCPC